MRKIFPLCAAVALVASFSLVNPVRAEEPSDFVREANQINLEEIELGHYAAEHSKSPEVRHFAAKLADDHQSASDDLQHVAHHHDMHLRDHMDDEHRHDVDHLESLHGMEFDHAFLDAMIDGHEHAIEIYEKAEHHAQHEDVRHYAEKVLPDLHNHLDMARDISDHMDHMHHH